MSAGLLKRIQPQGVVHAVTSDDAGGAFMPILLYSRVVALATGLVWRASEQGTRGKPA